MKKWSLLILALVCAIGLVGCKQDDKEDILHLGLNAEIVEIDSSKQIVYVSDTEEDAIFGGRCAIDCKKLMDSQNIIYVDYDTGEVTLIGLSDLAVGDKVIVNAYESQLNGVFDGTLEVEQIQLGTQRLN